MTWKPGESGNPEGRRVEKRWADAIAKELAQFELKDADGKVVIAQGEAIRHIARAVISKAIGADKDAYQEVGNRLDGKPKQQIEATGADGGALIVQITPADAKTL